MNTKYPTSRRTGAHTAAGWLGALAFTAAWYGLLQLSVASWFDVSLEPSAIPADLALHLALGAALYAIARGPLWFVAGTSVVLTLLHLGNAVKIAILGGPVMPDDMRALRNLFLILDGWQFVAWVSLTSAATLLVALMFHPRSRRAWIALGLVSAVTVTVVSQPAAVAAAMDHRFGNIVWDQRGNFQHRGLLVHLLQESARYLARAGRSPTQDEVAAAVAILDTGSTMPVRLEGPVDLGGGRPRRNLHVVLLESFWDPSLLGKAGLSADPMDPRFRALWEAAGHSMALSPVFGGYTANAEFEVLCGFPVSEDAVFFEGWLRRDVPCLPQHLGSAGYITLASHPNVAVFWNRVHAYRRLGFRTYWSIKDFELDDMNGEFLSDASLYRQVLTRIQPLLRADTPVLNYVVTLSGHLPYPLAASRPSVIRASSSEPFVEDYANTIYYKSRELMDFLEELRRVDPRALIVVFGDHLPFLGDNFRAYAESGLLASERGRFSDAMFHSFAATPLVVIDGEAGPVRLGELPLYRLPEVLLGLLGDARPSVMRLTRTPPGLAVRPLPGMHFLTDGTSVASCRGEQGDSMHCEGSARWLGAVETLTRDLFSGDQHLLQDPQRWGKTQAMSPEDERMVTVGG